MTVCFYNAPFLLVLYRFYLNHALVKCQVHLTSFLLLLLCTYVACVKPFDVFHFFLNKILKSFCHVLI